MHGVLRELNKNKVMFLMLVPALLFFAVFAYGPMVGVYYAFTNYNPNTPIFNNEFVGMQNFEFLFESGALWTITRNTILYNLAFIFIGNLLQIVCAVFLSELPGKWFKKTAQSVMFLPYFISFVLVGAFVFNLFSTDNGMVNTLLEQLGLPPYDFYLETAPWKYIIVFFSVWKGLGYGTVIYLAAIMSISDEYHEAAKIDGANIFQRMRFITIPMLIPTFILLVLLALGGILRGQFDLFYQIIGDNGMLFDATDVIDTYVYRALTGNFDVGMGTAAGLYQSFFGLVLVLTVNYVIRKTREDYAVF
jgi:putative aldouronate transport system permease protein